MRNTGLPAPFPGLAAPPPHFDLLRLDRSLDTFPRQTPGCAESKSRFHLELCLSCALRRSRSPLLPKGSCEQTPPKTEYTGIRRWDKPQQATALPAGVGATCWAQVRRASAAHCLGPSAGGCAQTLPPEARDHSSLPAPPPKFLRTATSHAFQRPEVFTCHRCVKCSKSSLTPRTCTKSQLLCEALMTQ